MDPGPLRNLIIPAKAQGGVESIRLRKWLSQVVAER